MALQKLLGTDTLLGKSGPLDTSTIEGKSILLYFSAHWCGPCRQFTPVLSNFFKDQKKKRDDFEIIFVTGDRSQADFDTYYAEHPWLALPFGGEEERKNRERLNKVFKVRGIPSLVVVDKNGKTATTDGRSMLQKDPQGANFPWIPKTIYESLAGAKMTTKSGAPLTVDDLKKLDTFALYFSASWCPPCRAFTPILCNTYNKLKSAGTKTEFIYVPSDRDAESYHSYYEPMPWSTLTFGGDAAIVNSLKQTCEVKGIPTLVTCNGSDGSIINSGARAAAGADSEGADYPWAKKPLPACAPFDSSNDLVVDAVNEDACVILSVSDAKDAAVVEFTKAAEKYQAENKDSKYPIHFFLNATAASAELYGRVLQAIDSPAPKAGAAAAVMTLHLSNRRVNSSLTGDITTSSVLEHVVAFKKAHA